MAGSIITWKSDFLSSRTTTTSETLPLSQNLRSESRRKLGLAKFAVDMAAPLYWYRVKAMHHTIYSNQSYQQYCTMYLHIWSVLLSRSCSNDSNVSFLLFSLRAWQRRYSQLQIFQLHVKLKDNFSASLEQNRLQYLWFAGCWHQINKIALSSFTPLWPREQNKHWKWAVWRVAKQGVPESGLCKNSEYVNPQMRESLYYPWQNAVLLNGNWLCEHNLLEGRLSSVFLCLLPLTEPDMQFHSLKKKKKLHSFLE